jgi:hypothetical protein
MNPTRTPQHPRTACLVGVGNIGSQCIDMLARVPGLERVLVVDRDRCESGNLGTQAIGPADVGRPKATVQARRLRRLAPHLDVEAFVGDLATLPLGRLRGTWVIGCLDSVEARLRLGEMAWRVGAPYLDAGVNPAAGLARVTCYLPGQDRPCYACGLSDEDYRALGARHPCGGEPAAPPTRGSFCLGGLAAAWVSLEWVRSAGRQPAARLAGREVLLATVSRQILVSTRRRNPQCRFDHASWRVVPFAGVSPRHSTQAALAAAAELLGAKGPVGLALPGSRFAKALHCSGCGTMVERFHVVGRGAPVRCDRCADRPLEPVGFKIVDRLDGSLPRGVLRMPLCRLGVCGGDILEAGSGRATRYLEIPGEATPAGPT